MANRDRGARLREEVESLLAGGGMELVDVELGTTSRGLVVRVLVDKPGGVSVEDCALVSRAVGDHLEALEAMPGHYILEVSSPGIDRPLTKPEDYQRFAGEAAEIATYEKIGDRHHYRGTLAGYDAATRSVLLAAPEGGTTAIPLAAIRKANLKRDPWPSRPEAKGPARHKAKRKR